MDGTGSPEADARGALGVDSSVRGRRSGAAERGPGLDPVVLVLAGRRRVVVGAVRLRRGPVPDLVVVGLVGRVRQLAVAGARASRRSRRPAGWSAPRRTRPSPGRWPRPTPCGPSTCTCSSGAWRFAGDHPGVGPAGRALVGQDAGDRLRPRPASGSTWNCQDVPVVTSPAAYEAIWSLYGAPVQRAGVALLPRAGRWPRRTAPR